MLSGPGRATWTAGALLVSAIIILPAATIAVLSLKGEESIWPQLAATVLPI